VNEQHESYVMADLLCYTTIMKNYLLKLEYDGSVFHGWQEQRNLRTVQGEIQEALSQVCGLEISVNGTSRTDAGVHALMQCCSFNADIGIPTENLPKAINNMLSGGRYGEGSKGSDLRVISAEEVPEDFHARFSCKGKTYKYIISCNEPSAFRRNYIYNLDAREIDIDAMNAAAKRLVGTHDFAAFQAAGGTPRETTVRTIFDAGFTTWGDSTNAAKISGTDECALPTKLPARMGDIVFSVTGDGFLYNMVRIIVGTLIEVGLRKKSHNIVSEIIESCDRTKAGHTAPACGLYLAKVFFDEEEMKRPECL